MLIVCEGEKTERKYLRALCTDLGLSSASAIITPSHRGSDPKSVVIYAIDRYREDAVRYDRVYCVFDRDTHASFNEAMALAESSTLARKGMLGVALSVPCFEFRVLLHFEFSPAPFASAGGRSPCDQVLEVIMRHFAGDAKSTDGLYDHLKPLTDQTLAHADRIEEENRRSGSINPSTGFHKPARYLRELATKG